MLVLSRKANQSISIDGGVKITVIAIDGCRVRLGFEAPDSVRILRSELLPFTAEWSDRETEPDASKRPDGVAVESGK